MDADLDLGVIGNCAWGGLVDRHGRLVWACLPRFDSDPLFPALVAGGSDHDGAFAVELLGLESSEQRYEGSTPILLTTLRDGAGSALEVRDFAPRFVNFGRIHRPTMLIRRIRPLEGEPRIRIVVGPAAATASTDPWSPAAAIICVSSRRR